MDNSDSKTTVQELRDIVFDFHTERDWIKHHEPRRIAVSICLEAAELLELFQWSEELEDSNRQALQEELSDVMIYCMTMANAMNIDLSDSIRQKMKKNAVKYPV